MVLAEEYFKNQDHNIRLIHKLVEKVEEDPGELVKSISLFQDRLIGMDWFTDTSNPMIHYVQEENKKLKFMKKPKIRYKPAPDIHKKNIYSAYSQLLKNRIKLNKTLFFGKGSIIGSELGPMQEDMSKYNPADYPVASALYYALAGIDLKRGTVRNNRKKYRVADSAGGY